MPGQYVGIEDAAGRKLTVSTAGGLSVTATPVQPLTPVTSLNAITIVGTGVALDAGQVINGATLYVLSTGAPVFNVELEGSLDGVVWFRTGAATTVTSTAARTEVQARYYRANLTALTGGVVPTITATIAATFS